MSKLFGRKNELLGHIKSKNQLVKLEFYLLIANYSGISVFFSFKSYSISTNC